MSIPTRIITVSDRCSAGVQKDVSGPLAERLLADYGAESSVVVIPDGADSVESAIRDGIADGCRLIFTTGGTGITPRDLTPEGTARVLVTQIPGLADQIRLADGTKVPAACLSRGLVGLTSREKDAALVVNAPGSTGGVRDAIAVLGPLLDHIMDQLSGHGHEHGSGTA